MKKMFLGIIAIALSTSAFADQYNWYNIVNINVPYGASNSLQNPIATLRPFRGDLFRISVPKNCSSVNISSFQLWGRAIGTNQWINLNANMLYTENNPFDYSNHFVYQVNGGRAATIYAFGAYITSAAYPTCIITLEQARSFQAIPLPAPTPMSENSDE